jgi:hypothetical protein
MRHALYGVCVGPGVRIKEVDAVVDSVMPVTLRTETVVRTPAFTENRSAGFDPVTYDGHQCVGSSVLYGKKKCFAGLSFDTAKHPLTLNRVSRMILSPTELALVNFDSLVRTTEFTGQLSKNTSIVSLQNMTQSATVCALRRSSCWILRAGSRLMMSYVMARISRRVRLLRWNHDPCLMDAD